MLYVDTMQMLRAYLWIVAILETLALVLVVVLKIRYDGQNRLLWFAGIGCAVSYLFLVLSYFVRIRGIG